jgi:hypothetical protein
MPQFAWSIFAEKHKRRHLVVVEVPADVTETPASLVGLLIKGLEPMGDFALCAEEAAERAILLCAFALATDADGMIEAINAQENNRYFGWASEHHGVIDQTTAGVIRDIDNSSAILEVSPT